MSGLKYRSAATRRSSAAVRQKGARRHDVPGERDEHQNRWKPSVRQMQQPRMHMARTAGPGARTYAVSSRFAVSGMPSHASAARKNAAPVMANATPKPCVPAIEPTTKGATALAMRPTL